MINAGAPDSWEFEFDEQPVQLELVDSQPVVTAIVRSTNRIGGLTIERAGGGSQVGKINWTLQGFAAQGVVLLAGEGGCGKTSLMYRAAESIQEGDLFLNE
jgi:type II secretory ATPase GspE/PulE/Tfp pilus assembly ATPase PilB-like protein